MQKKTSFQPFENFEHLAQYMTPEEQKELSEIRTKPPSGDWDKSASLSSFFNLGSKEEAEKTSLCEKIKKAVETDEPFSLPVNSTSKFHTFYLELGLLPLDFQFSYIVMKYGKEAYEALRQFKEKEKLNEDQRDHLMKILGEEKGLTAVTYKDVQVHRKFLETLSDKTASFLRDRFIPQLFSFLENPTEENREKLDLVGMHLSIRGRERWETAIKHQHPFKPFKISELLSDLLTPAQEETLMSLSQSL